MRRNKAIKFLSLFYFVFGITSFINAFVIDNRIASYEASQYTLPDFYLPTMQIASIILGTTGVAIGIGLFTLREWGRKLVFIREGLYFLYTIVFFIIFTCNYHLPYLMESGKPMITGIIQPVFSIAYIVTIFWYLTRPSVKAYFNGA